MARLGRYSPAEVAEAVSSAGRESRVAMVEGTPPWCLAVLHSLKSLYPFLEANHATFQREWDQLSPHEPWNFLPSPDAPYGDEDAMLTTEVGATAAQLVRRLSNAQRITQEAGEAGGHGGDRRSPGYQEMNSSLDTPKKGITARHAARLKRDHKDIHARLAAGEFRSVRAAAIEAGIITPRPRLNAPLDNVLALAALLRQRLSETDLAALIAALME